MTRYSASGGDILSANGRKVDLADALDWAMEWAQKAVVADRAGCQRLAKVYALDALSIYSAYERAWKWRKCSGWARPEDADTGHVAKAVLSAGLTASLATLGADHG